MSVFDVLQAGGGFQTTVTSAAVDAIDTLGDGIAAVEAAKVNPAFALVDPDVFDSAINSMVAAQAGAGMARAYAVEQMSGIVNLLDISGGARNILGVPGTCDMSDDVMTLVSGASDYLFAELGNQADAIMQGLTDFLASIIDVGQLESLIAASKAAIDDAAGEVDNVVQRSKDKLAEARKALMDSSLAAAITKMAKDPCIRPLLESIADPDMLAAIQALP